MITNGKIAEKATRIRLMLIAGNVSLQDGFLINTIVCGDALEVLKTFPSEFIQCVVTSPPYWGLRDYQTATWEGGDIECNHKGSISRNVSGAEGLQYIKKGKEKNVVTSGDCKCGAERIDQQLGLEKTPELYVEKLVEIFRELKRVLRKDGTLWLNMGDSYVSSRLDGSHGGWNASSGHYSNPVRNDGIDRKADVGNLKPKDLVGIPWRVAFALQADGWYLRSDIIWAKPNPMPESVTDRPTKSHEYVFLLTKSANYFYDADAIREESKYPEDDRKSRVNPETAKDHQRSGNLIQKGTSIYPKRNKRSVWTIPTEPFSEAHFATFPKKLVAICIKAGTSEWGQCVECGSPWERIVEKATMNTRPGLSAKYNINGDYKGHETKAGLLYRPVTFVKNIGWQPTCKCKAEREPQIVLDPFSGSGTTLLIARKLSRKYIGIDLSKDYIKMSNRRLAQQELFA